ncbi:ribonuclease H-like protein, partial [Linderina pennispora]
KPDDRRLIAYADGAYLPDRGSAGIGVYFENAGLAPIAKRLRGHQSNARAEVYALVTALEQMALAVQDSEGVEIWVCSDSRYAVDGINVHAEAWRQAQWKTAKGRPVANRTAFVLLHQSMARLGSRGHTVFVHHLPAHAGIRGNEIADMLAK